MLPAVNLFCYGQVESPYGSRPVHQGSAGGGGDLGERGALRDRRQGSHLRLHQGVPGHGQVGRHGQQAHPPPRAPARHPQADRGLRRGYGLDFFDTVFEVLGFDEINMVAAYGGFPNRYPHWRFGMEYERLSKGYEYGLSKIYEMVINNDPSYAYLLESNMDVDQKLVMAHVFGHVDFFKNNFMFRHTNRKMMDQMANHATRIRRYLDELRRRGGRGLHRPLPVAREPDRLPVALRRRRRARPPGSRGRRARTDPRWPRASRPTRVHAGVHQPPRVPRGRAASGWTRRPQKQKKFPEQPERDVLLFLLEHAPLERWEHDVLSIVREEAYYFAPQGQTKIMNEGWATYWHSTIMTAEGARRPPRSSTTPTTTPARSPPSPGSSTPTSSASSCSATSRTAGTRAASARSTTSATPSWSASTGTRGSGSAARRSSRSASTTTT